MDHRPFNAKRAQESYPKENIGQLADGRIGQPSLEVVFADSKKRSHEHCKRGHNTEHYPETEVFYQIDTEHVTDNSHKPENTGLDNSHGMQQGAYRCGRHHSAGQPGVKRHPGSFHGAQGKQNKQQNQSAFRG